MDFRAVLTLLPLVLLICAYFPFFRYRLRKLQGRKWPTVVGMIQRGEVRRGGPTRFQALVYRSVLGYSYIVNGLRYAGFVVIIGKNQDDAEALQKQCEGKSVTVKYDPQNPDSSFLVEGQLLDRSLLQNPFYLS